MTLEKSGQRKKRAVPLQTEVTPAASAAFAEAVAASGMTKTEASSRLVEWFARQDMTTRMIIMANLEEADVPVVAAVALRRLAKANASLFQEAQEVYAQAEQFREVRKRQTR